MSWTLIHSTDWSGYADTASGTVPDGWLTTGSAPYYISGGKLAEYPLQSAGYVTQRLVRPTAENHSEQRLVVTLPANFVGNGVPYVGLCLRIQTDGSCYLISADAPDSTCSIYALNAAGTPTAIGKTVAWSIAYNASHAYTLDVAANGTTPTALTITVTDTTAGTVVCQFTHADDTTELQSTGGYGVTAWAGVAPNITPSGYYLGAISTYSGSAAVPVVGFLGIGDSYWTSTDDSGNVLSSNAAGFKFGPALQSLYGSTATVAVDNQGIGGTTTAQWAAGSTDLNAAIASAPASVYPDVMVHLGINDAVAGNTAAQQKTATENTVNALLGSGYNRVFLNYPPTLPNSSSVSSAANALLAQYGAVYDAVAQENPTQVFSLPQERTLTAAHPEYIGPNQVHPTTAGAAAIGGVWASQAYAVLMPAAPTAPEITSPSTVTFLRGTPSTFQPEASGNPTGWSFAGLPASCTGNVMTGEISYDGT